METFQDLSLPIPGKEDLAKLHSAIYQNVPAKPGACGDSYAAQGWLAFIVEYIRRYTCLPTFPPSADPRLTWTWQATDREQQSSGICRAKFRHLEGTHSWMCRCFLRGRWGLPQPPWDGLGWV